MFLQKILSYSVFKLKFLYCAFTSPHISVHSSKSRLIFDTTDYRNNINYLTSYFMQLKIKLTFCGGFYTVYQLQTYRNE